MNVTSINQGETPDGAEDRLAAMLLDGGMVTVEQMGRAQALAADNGERLHVVLVRLGWVPESKMARVLSDFLGLPLAGPADYPNLAVMDDKLSARFLSDSKVLPLSVDDQGLCIAMADPLDAFTRQAVELAVGLPVQIRVADPVDLDRAFERLYQGPGEGGLLGGGGGQADASVDEDIERLRDLASEAPVVQLVNRMIERAVEQRASDIHIEPFGDRLRVRYRVDGILSEVEGPPSQLQAAVISRIKIVANMNIAERRLPQDGRVRMTVRGKPIDLRVATLPTMHGESLVMRILDRSAVTLDLPALGFVGDQEERFRKVLANPEGVVLVVGPTGSGKTTTLYASLVALNSPTRKVLTVEDPIEYQLDGVNQIQVMPQIGLTFANVLRSILRQDPDVIMVGEIRDLETAQMAVQAALTGHMVLSTLHTNTAAAAATRLLDMGIEDYLLTSTLTAIVAQRLVRSLCSKCRDLYAPMPEMLAQLGVANDGGEPPVFYHPRGCDACNNTGYSGRTAIVELLTMDGPIRRLILARAETAEIERTARELGMATMLDDGLAKVKAGMTSIEEVLRVTREV